MRSLVAVVAAALLALASVEAKTAKEICASPTCLRGGTETISLEKALLLAPCLSEDLKCFGYGATGGCPFPNMVDCSKDVPQPTLAPVTVAPTTPSPTTTASTTTPKPTEAESSSNYYPYIIAGGAVALLGIGALVFVLVRKSGRRNNQDDDDVEAIEYGKVVAVDAKEEPVYGYHQAENKSFGDVPMHQRQNKSFMNPDLRRQNTGSFVTAAQPIARPNTTSFLQNNSNVVVTTAALPPPHDVKEQFYVPETAQEFHHGGAAPARDQNRRESFEF